MHNNNLSLMENILLLVNRNIYIMEKNYKHYMKSDENKEKI